MYGGVLNVMEVIRHLCFNYAGDGRDLPERVSSLLYRILKPWWELFVATTPGSFIDSCKGSTVFCEVPILTRIDGITTLPVVRFPFSPDGDLLLPTKQTFFENCPEKSEEIRVFGQSVNGDGMALPLGSQTQVMSTIEALYQRAISAHPDTVGGPIDIGFIDTHGARWLVRKPDLD
jgi:hypothetical protein